MAYRLPSSAELISKNVDFKTQVRSVQFETSKLLSVLLTNENFLSNAEVVESDRTAIYDGVVTIGEELTIIVETKPRVDRVWEEQLNPSKFNISGQETDVIEKPCIIAWKDLILWLNQFTISDRNNYSERLLGADFLSYVNEQFPELNPFDRFDLCRRSRPLMQKRVEKLLKNIALDADLVKYHHGWGYYIETPYASIRKLGLILYVDRLEVSLYFGDTQSQAKAFYPKNIDVNSFQSAGWDIRPNFHLAYMTSNKVWFESDDLERYLTYWNSNAHTLHQLPSHDSVKHFLSNLVKEGIILSGKEEVMQSAIYDTNMQGINVCPGLCFLYQYGFQALENLDRDSKMEESIKEKITYCVKNVLNISVKDILT